MDKSDSFKNSKSTEDNYCNIAIFGSGQGTNAKNIAEFFRDHPCINIRLFVSNKQDAGIIERAKQCSISSEVINNEQLKDEDYMLSLLSSYEIDFIVLAGFLVKIPEFLIKAFPNKIINTHPALLPAFGGKGMYGMNVHNAVKLASAKKSGMTIHYVNENYDEGAIIFQRETSIDQSDSIEMIAAKVQNLEYEWYPKVIENLLNDKR